MTDRLTAGRLVGVSTPTNLKLAGLFDRMAAVLDLTGANPFRVGAYQRGARALENLSQDVSAIADVPSLTAVPGIGKGLAEKIIEYVQTGHIAEIDLALKDVPPGVLGLLAIPGLGAKSVATLWKKGGVTSVEDLKKKLPTGELEKLPRMGKKLLEKVSQALSLVEAGGNRIRLGDAMPIAQAFVERVKLVAGVMRAEVAGSLRRGRETVADIDIVASCLDPDEQAGDISRALQGLPGVESVLAAGSFKVSVRGVRGLQIDIRIVRNHQYGAALLYFTGSKDHNIALRERAIRGKLTLNEYGLWRDETRGPKGKPLAGTSEEEVYRALGLAYIEPELRESRGEIDAAAEGKLPRLIELSDIKAELHAHTVASDGVWTVEELALAAKGRGFHTVAVTDHSVSQHIANGLDPKRLEKHAKAIRKLNESGGLGITILAGCEVDILGDGRLDYPDSILSELDIVVASPHAPLRQDPQAATRRMLRAIENPYVHIIGHPTGRMPLRREGIAPDMAQLVKAAAATGTALEINSNYYRLDLRDTHARAAVEAGVSIAIDTDAHGPADLEMLRYGVTTARRGWVQAKQVINCLDAAALKQWLTQKRQRLG